MALRIQTQKEFKEEKKLSPEPVIDPRDRIKSNKKTRDLTRETKARSEAAQTDKQRPGLSYLEADDFSELEQLKDSGAFYIVSKILSVSIELAKEKKNAFVIYPASKTQKLPISPEKLVQYAFTVFQSAPENIGEHGKVSGQLTIDDAFKTVEQGEGEKQFAELKPFFEENIRSALRHRLTGNVSHELKKIYTTHAGLFKRLEETYGIKFVYDHTGMMVDDKLARFESKAPDDLTTKLYDLFHLVKNGKPIPQTEEAIEKFIHSNTSEPAIRYGHKEAAKPKYPVAQFDTTGLRVDQKNELSSKQTSGGEYYHFFAFIDETYPNLTVARIDKTNENAFIVMSENEPDEQDIKDANTIIEAFEKANALYVVPRPGNKEKRLTLEIFQLMLENVRDNNIELFTQLSAIEGLKERYTLTYKVLGKPDPAADIAKSKDRKQSPNLNSEKIIGKIFWDQVHAFYKGTAQKADDGTEKNTKTSFMASSARLAKKLLSKETIELMADNLSMKLSINRKNNHEIFLRGEKENRDYAIAYLCAAEIAITLLEEETQKIIFIKPGEYSIVPIPVMSTKVAGFMTVFREVSALLKPPKQDDKKINQNPEYAALEEVVQVFRNFKQTLRKAPHSRGFDANDLLSAYKTFDYFLEKAQKEAIKEKEAAILQLEQLKAQDQNAEETPEMLLEGKGRDLIIEKTTIIREMVKAKIEQAQQRINKHNDYNARRLQTVRDTFTEDEQINTDAMVKNLVKTRNPLMRQSALDALELALLTAVYSNISNAALNKSQLSLVMNMFYEPPRQKKVVATKVVETPEPVQSYSLPKLDMNDGILIDDKLFSVYYNNQFKCNCLDYVVRSVGFSPDQNIKKLLSATPSEKVLRTNIEERTKAINNLVQFVKYETDYYKDTGRFNVNENKYLTGLAITYALDDNYKPKSKFLSLTLNRTVDEITPKQLDDEFKKTRRSILCQTLLEFYKANTNDKIKLSIQETKKTYPTGQEIMECLYGFSNREIVSPVLVNKTPTIVRTNEETGNNKKLHASFLETKFASDDEEEKKKAANFDYQLQYDPSLRKSPSALFNNNLLYAAFAGHNLRLVPDDFNKLAFLLNEMNSMAESPNVERSTQLRHDG